MGTSPTAAFDALVLAHQGEVHRVCRSILRDEHLCADAAQETFLRLWRRSAQGREPAHSRAWLRKVALSASLDVARRRAEWDARARSDEDVAADAASADERSPSSELSAAELERRFRAALTELPEGQRTIFLLRHDGDLSLAEVAEVLDVALATVKTQFARAALKLQQKLKAFEPDRSESA